ncbi:PAS domain S-box-containing protein [Mucilaginibacter gracilis]|uniref:PAS domain S-box-containing protein n=1 Tax=Mucilaginibacter gracilis TaxID=423350 RepID=A0A495IWU0_9SPHI|nr:PAS domain-containing protein [Mucilaginibacter gracilis]RKR81206.1 PAS domain S-box-containing protein [Mucilaginibacter gracilis]
MLNKLLYALNDFAWAYNPALQQYVFIGPNAQQVLGLSTDEVSADVNFLQKRILAEDKEHVLKVIESLTPNNWVELYYRINIDGETKWLFEKRTCFIEEGSNHEVVLSVIKDVSDQKAVKYHLEKALGDFSVLFEKNKSPMWIYEIPSLRIIKVNQAAIGHYGYSHAEFLNMTIRDVRPKLDLAAFNEYIFRKGITKNKLRGNNAAGIWRHQNKSGDIIYAEITGHEIKYNHTSCRIIIATDVTERVLFEEERDKEAAAR